MKYKNEDYIETQYPYEELLLAYNDWISKPKRKIINKGESIIHPLDLMETLKSWYFYCDIRDNVAKGTNWNIFKRSQESDYTPQRYIVRH